MGGGHPGSAASAELDELPDAEDVGLFGAGGFMCRARRTRRTPSRKDSMDSMSYVPFDPRLCATARLVRGRSCLLVRSNGRTPGRVAPHLGGRTPLPAHYTAEAR